MVQLFLEALAGKNTSGRPPVWLMRQAGRYMEEYQALRKRYDLMTLFSEPELIATVTQMPIKAFGFDAAIIFSDILLIAKALGFSLRFEEGAGPKIEPTIVPADVKKLCGKQVSLDFVIEAIRLLKPTLTVPLIGFAGAPFTVASYMIEGGSSKLKKTKKWLLEEPETFFELLDILAEATIQYLNAQIDAGAQAVQLFDSWANVLSREQFERFSLHFMKKIVKGIKKCPVILFCRGSSFVAAELMQAAPQAISIDWQSPLSQVREHVGKEVCLQGNLDPDVLLTSPQVVKREVRAILNSMSYDPAFIFNLGHGIHPETPRENVYALVEEIHAGY